MLTPAQFYVSLLANRRAAPERSSGWTAPNSCMRWLGRSFVGRNPPCRKT
jgi:hypothetical protein